MTTSDPPPPSAVQKRVAPVVPFACIKLSDKHSYCGREDVDEKNEFMFTNVARAVQLYRNGKHLRACTGCVGAAELAAKQAGTDLAPMATRGMKENDR
jgi:hypothetical protein